MESALLFLYKEYIKDLINWNKNKPPLDDYQDPSFDTFMRWLQIREENKKPASQG